MLQYFQILGYPSKPIGLFIRQSIIFRSDSNGEDLEGYAGAGLYDRWIYFHELLFYLLNVKIIQPPFIHFHAGNSSVDSFDI